MRRIAASKFVRRQPEFFTTGKAHGFPSWRPFSRPAVSRWLPSIGSPAAIRPPSPR
jgi:hypothetical protein